MMARKCYLKCAEGTHEPILLNEKEETIIGRSSITKIKDSKCSRQQVKFHVNIERREIKVTQLGDNPSSINGSFLYKHQIKSVKHGDSIDILHGSYKHFIEFDPPPSPEKTEISKNGEPSLKRLKLNDDVVKESKWEMIENGKLMVYTAKGVQHSSKIASYDFDWTIVATSSGKVYPRDKDDWCILLPEIPGHLKKLRSEGYKIVLFSNQSGISSGKIKPQDFRSKIENVIARLGVPMQVFIATGTNLFRKPATGMWETLIEKYNANKTVNLEESHYCGDAAGRPADWAPKKKKDFSCSDRLYAMNIGIKFFTPEEHFLGSKKAPFSLPDFQPMNLPLDIPECIPPNSTIISQKQELVLMVGSPGSGKTFFAKSKLVSAGYKYVSRDELKTSTHCIEAVKQGLRAGKSVVVDNTNPDVKSRARFISEAKTLGIIIRCFVMTTSTIHAKHNIRFRELTNPTHAKIPDMVLYSYQKIYQEPTCEEGFKEILKINFIPKFGDIKLQELYQKYLI